MAFLLGLAWVLAVVVLLLALLLAALLASWLRLQGRFDETTLRLQFGWRLVSGAFDVRGRCFELYLFERRVLRREGRPEDTSKRQRKREAKRQRDRRRGERRRQRRASRLRPGPASWRFYLLQLRYLRGRLHLDRLEGDVRVASPDPALTGMAYGTACSLVYPLTARFPQARLTLTPDFVGTLPGGRLAFAFRIRIATVALVAWRVLWFERSRARRYRARSAGKEGRPHATQ